MDEKPGRLWKLVVVVSLPLIVVLMIAALLFLGTAFYLRTAAVALLAFVRFLLGRDPVIPLPRATQRPHFLDVNVPTQKSEPNGS